MERIPSGRSKLGAIITVQSSRAIRRLPQGRQPRRGEALSGEVTTHFKGGVVVRFIDEDNLTHVPMSPRARTSALDLWLAVIKCL